MIFPVAPQLAIVELRSLLALNVYILIRQYTILCHVLCVALLLRVISLFHKHKYPRADLRVGA